MPIPFSTTFGTLPNASEQSQTQADYVCDGIDDQVEIQAAIAALPSAGGKTYLTEGKFSISDAITINKELSLAGCSIHTTEIFLADGADADMIVLDATGLDHVFFAEVKSLTLNGNKTNQSVATKCLWLKENFSDCIFSDLFLVNCKGNPIEISDGWLHRFTRIWVELYDGIGIHMQETGSKVSGLLSFTDSRISGGINNVKIEGPSELPDTPWDSCFTGCVFAGAEQHGVSLNSASGWIFNGCFFKSASGSAADTYDVFYADSSTEIVVTGCIIDGASSSRYGVNLVGTSDYISVVGNVLVDHLTASVHVESGANTHGEIESNVGYTNEILESSCFIATAAYGTPAAEQIDILREFRDKVLLRNRVGAMFVSLYYEASPPIADFISQHEVFRTIVRNGFIEPLVAVVRSSQGLWNSSEQRLPLFL